MKCDVIAQGIIYAAKTVRLRVPIVVRLEGTNMEAGKQLIAEAGLRVIAADDLADAAKKAVAAATSKTAAQSSAVNPETPNKSQIQMKDAANPPHPGD
jgi:hypothetical protein